MGRGGAGVLPAAPQRWGWLRYIAQMSIVSTRPHAQAPDFSTPDFRLALGHFATGVTIVTTRAPDGRWVGLTANSFNAVSLSPPLVLWSLAQGSGSLPAFQAATHYGVHVLTADQRALAERFATRDVDRFAGLDVRTGPGGVPLLAGCAAVFTCFNRSRYPEGDHVIFVGEVEHCQQDPQAAPLLYHRGRFLPPAAHPAPLGVG